VGTPRQIPPWASHAILLEHPTWYQGYWLKMLSRRVRQIRYARRGIEAHLILNTAREHSMAKSLGLRATFASQNLYLDESTFRPLDRVKDFDAVYVAKLEPFKRHALAANVEKLAILKVADVNLEETYPSVAHATTNRKPLTFPEVADFINRSHCSLALSKEEGGMLASFESLLCGVPVVSTHSRGGRDLFYDSENSTLVEANAASVANAVSNYTKNSASPGDIRRKAIRDLKKHRAMYSTYIASIISRQGGPNIDIEHFIRSRFENGAADRLFVDNEASRIPERILELLP
jgi:glycosyltransferase involved in cell wall biosynthesis